MQRAVVSLIVVAGALTASASAQSTYSFEMRLIPDGATGAPTGLGTEYNIGNPSAVTATRIGFWLQARVSQTVNQNWGINRFSAPAATQGGGPAFISVTDSINATSISRGTVDSSDSLYGRGEPYRNGPLGNTNNTNTGNSGTHNENGFLDSTGPSGSATMITGIDDYMGPYRTGTSNPWGINGDTGGVAWPSDGTFAPWANLYRVWIDITDFTSRDITLDAHGLVNGTVQTQDIGGGFWPMQTAVPEGQVLDSNFSFETASFHFHIAPTPGAAGLLGLGGVFASRRRR